MRKKDDVSKANERFLALYSEDKEPDVFHMQSCPFIKAVCDEDSDASLNKVVQETKAFTPDQVFMLLSLVNPSAIFHESSNMVFEIAGQCCDDSEYNSLDLRIGKVKAILPMLARLSEKQINRLFLPILDDIELLAVRLKQQNLCPSIGTMLKQDIIATLRQLNQGQIEQLKLDFPERKLNESSRPKNVIELLAYQIKQYPQDNVNLELVKLIFNAMPLAVRINILKYRSGDALSFLALSGCSSAPSKASIFQSYPTHKQPSVVHSELNKFYQSWSSSLKEFIVIVQSLNQILRSTSSSKVINIYQVLSIAHYLMPKISQMSVRIHKKKPCFAQLELYNTNNNEAYSSNLVGALFKVPLKINAGSAQPNKESKHAITPT